MLKKRRLWVVVVALAAVLMLALAACGDDGDDSESVTIDLAQVGSSGQSGTATLTEASDGKTKVVIELSNPPAEAQPAHIHKGTCTNPDPTPAYPLNDVVDGSSESEADVSLKELLDGEFLVNVHRSADDLATYVACGNISGEYSGGGGY